MSAATAKVLDFNHPDTARVVGGELEQTSQSLVRRLESNEWLATEADAQQAVLDRQTLGDAIKRVEEFFAPLKKMAYDLHKALCARETAILAPMQRVDTIKRTALGAFKVEQDRIRREEEERQAAEQRRQDEERAQAEAAAAHSSGQPELADAILEEQIAAPPPAVVLPDRTRAVEGLKYRRDWKWRYATSEARALQLLPREYLTVDQKKVNAIVKAMKGSAQLPGIQVYYEDVPVR